MAKWPAVVRAPHLRQAENRTRTIVGLSLRLVLAALVGICAAMVFVLAGNLGTVGGLLTWLASGITVLCGLWLVHDLLLLAASSRSRRPRRRWLARLALATAATMLSLTAVETVLLLVESRAEGPDRLVLPEEWKHFRINAPGAHRAWLWHGVPHVTWTPEWQFRRTGPFPARSRGSFRIAVVGDSLTFGLGVFVGSTYPAILEAALSEHYSAEVINLGVNGAQSEDVLSVVEYWLPELQPDLVVYGICLNDFLDSGGGGDQQDRAYALPVPDSWMAFVRNRTLTGRFLDRAYNRALITLGLRNDFYGQMLQDLDRLAPRFTWDLLRINDTVVASGLPPVVAMVLDQRPVRDGPGQLLATEAEEAALLSGMTVVPSMRYYDLHTGRNLSVSPWEGHPNTEAHRLFAEMLLPAISSTPGLEEYRR